MKRILYIGNELSHSGKTATTIDTLSKLLETEGYIVHTASNKKNKLLRLLDMLLTIMKLFKEVDYVLIDTYSTQNFYYAYLCSCLCRMLKLKYIPILHGGNLPNRLKRNPKLSRTIFKGAYVNVAPSEYTKSKFEALGYENTTCIANAIEIENYPFEKKVLNAVKMLWVRSFSELYNPNLAIKTLYELKQKNVESSLCMVGPENDGTLEKAKDYAKSLDLDVTFTGKLSKKEWIALSVDCNVFINTTNFDNMPVSVMEAMALGLPVVSTNVGGMPFLIETNKDGVLIEPNDSTAFVNAILDLKEKPEKTLNLTIKARRKVEGYDWSFVKLKWHAILK